MHWIKVFTRAHTAWRLLAGVALVLLAGVSRSQAQDSEIDRALADINFTWLAIAEDGMRLYYQPGSFAERHRIMLMRSAQAALAKGLEFLDLKADDRELRVIYVDDRAQMEQLTGHHCTGYADWTGHGIFLACSPCWRSFDTHEIAHILTMRKWGTPVERSTWMIEGIPIAVDGWCQTADVDRIASYLVSKGRWPGLTAFTADPWALGEIPAGVMAASLIRHLRQRFGAPVIREAWSAGLEAALKARKTDPKKMEAEWLDKMRKLADPITDEEWQKLKTGGCG